MRRITASEVDVLMHSRAELLASGVTERRLRAAVASGAIRRVRRGWFVSAQTWRELWPEGRHLLHVIAVARDSRGACPVFSHASAAVLLGFPLYRHRPERVHVRVGGARASCGPDVFRHEGRIRDDDVTSIDGLRLTGAVPTVVDTARTLPLAAALAIADASLRLAAVERHVQHAARAQAWRAALDERLAAVRGGRGLLQARWVIGFADGRAQLTGESVSRLQLHRLGLTPSDLQVQVPGPGHSSYWVDFGLDDIDAFGEYDGTDKYTDAAMRGGRTLEEVLIDEKRREDWIRAKTGRRMLRWGDEQASSAEALGTHLAAAHVELPPGSARHHPPYS